ncbi:MAG: FixH family protein [Pseudomonadota bacterium]
MMATTIPTVSESKSTQAGVRPGRWIPWVFVGLFGIVLIANGTMITVAITTFTGMETVSAYKKGVDYNERLAAAAKQEALGWKASLDAKADDAGRMVITFALDDRGGAPVAAADVLAKVDRPLQDGLDQMVVFDEIESGRYRAAIDLPLEGQWEVQIDAVARGDRYQFTERIMVPR